MKTEVLRNRTEYQDSASTDSSADSRRFVPAFLKYLLESGETWSEITHEYLPARMPVTRNYLYF